MGATLGSGAALQGSHNPALCATVPVYPRAATVKGDGTHGRTALLSAQHRCLLENEIEVATVLMKARPSLVGSRAGCLPLVTGLAGAGPSGDDEEPE
jgi:hypothetical protein